MKLKITLLAVLLSFFLFVFGKIDRYAVVSRHNITTTVLDTLSPAQVGNGEFAFNMDITGLQTFVPFNTLAQWSWHSFPLPKGVKILDYQGVNIPTFCKDVSYEDFDQSKPVISEWLTKNPHRFNLGRIGFILKKSNGSICQYTDLKDCIQKVDLWTGIVTSKFKLDNEWVEVQTSCHGEEDVLGVTIKTSLLEKERIAVFFDFPYPDDKYQANYCGIYNKPLSHHTTINSQSKSSVELERKLDETYYFVNINWTTKAKFLKEDDVSPHRFILKSAKDNTLSFTVQFVEKQSQDRFTIKQVEASSRTMWNTFWTSGAAVNLSGSKDSRWFELERRIVLSQYVLRLNEAGSLPPQESGLVNNGWYGRFHFEMIWWHGLHYALWNRWNLFEGYLNIYNRFLSSSTERAKKMGRLGAKWPKCTADIDREWPNEIHATLIWQQPHPIYFAEQDYRLHPTEVTLQKWKDIVFASADYMVDYVHFEQSNDRYVLGPPLYVVSENVDKMKAFNPSFELGYWRYGLRIAQEWCKRLKMQRDEKYDDVLNRLAEIPQQDGLYVTYEGISDMWTKYNYEHPGIMAIYGMLPGDGVDKCVFDKTIQKVTEAWNFQNVWGWDFPVLAMAAARSGKPELAVDMLLYPSKQFKFDVHGLATGGPFPYFPSNGGLLAAVAMMLQG